jgi:glycosyltransferase involved in cell wall biosynthesis
MRIALVVTGGVDPSARHHVIPSLLALIERLARRYAVDVYALRYMERPCSYSLLGATVYDLGRPQGLRAQYAALLRALAVNGPYDLLHAYWALPAGLVTSLAGRRLRVPSIVVFDSGEFVAIPDIGYGLQRRWTQRLAVRTTIRLATRTVVCSRFQERLARAHGARPEVIPIGPDLRVFNGTGNAGIDRSRHEGAPWRLLHVANLNPVKDQPTLLRALKLIVSRVPGVHLDVVGLDTLGGAVQSMARELGLSGHISFHGFQPSERVADFYRRAHLLVLSSRHEAAGMVTMEAAACGLPVVGTSVGYVADLAPEADAGVPVADPDALAGRIVDLLADPDGRRHLADNARAWAVAHDADWTAREFARVYEEAAHTRDPRIPGSSHADKSR